MGTRRTGVNSSGFYAIDDRVTRMNLEQTIELYEFLKGETPEGFTLKTGQPQLSEDVAFTIIYVLQEKFHLIPDHFEQCRRCQEIFDMECEGRHYEDPGINLCDGCIDQIFYRESSQDADTHEKAVIEWYKVQSSASLPTEETKE